MERNHSSDTFKLAEIAKSDSGAVPRSRADFRVERGYNSDFKIGTDGGILDEPPSGRKTVGG
jgi:hypothetical protein